MALLVRCVRNVQGTATMATTSLRRRIRATLRKLLPARGPAPAGTPAAARPDKPQVPFGAGPAFGRNILPALQGG